MFLSALLVVNVISALIAQQEKQIGIMKAIGARSWQIIGLYFGMVLSLGLAACVLAIPFSNLGADALAAFVAELINFDPPKVEFTLSALLLQFGVGLLVPLIAAAPSILNGTRVSPAKVLSEYGINQVWRGAGLVDSHPAPLPPAHPRHVAGPAQSLPQTRAADPLAGHADLCGSGLYGHRQPASFAQLRPQPRCSVSGATTPG